MSAGRVLVVDDDPQIRRVMKVTLTGQVVTLEPLRRDHHDDLVAAASDGRLWELWYTGVPTPEGMAADVAAKIAARDAGTMLPFVVRRTADGTAVGVTTCFTSSTVIFGWPSA